jgi:hypothetical protein
LKALAARDLNIQKLYVDDIDFLTVDDRERLWKESHFETFLLSLKKYLSTEKENVFIDSLVAQLSYQFSECLQLIEQKLVANSPKEELPAAMIIKEEILTAKSRFDSYEHGLSKNVNARMDAVEKKLKNMLDSIVRFGNQRCEEIKRQIDSIKTIEEFHRVFGEDGSKSSTIVNSFYNRHFEQLKKDLTSEISSVRNDMLLEIRELIPNIANLKKSNIDGVNIGKKTFTFSTKSNTSTAQTRINEIDARIAQLHQKQSAMYREKSQIDTERSSLNRQASNLQGEINSVNYKISSLGRRPDVRQITRYKVEERSIFNPKRWFGSKYKEPQPYTDYDDSAQRDYDKKRQALDSERSSKNAQLAAIRRQIENLPDMEYQLNVTARQLEREVKEKEYQLNEIRKQKEAQEKEKAAGREAFLNSRKTALFNTLRSILANEQSELHRSLRSDAKQCLSELRGKLTDIIRTYFKEESGNYIKQLNVMLDNISTSVGNKEIEQKRKALNINKKQVCELMDELGSITK